MKFSLILVSLLLMTNVYAEQKEMDKVDKLDMLDKQSQEFFKAITGLEKDYLNEQINNIEAKNKQKAETANKAAIINQNPNAPIKEEITPEEYEKNLFKHQNELARLTSDFTRTKQLKDIKIKSMYSFNGNDYVVLKLDNAAVAAKGELSSNIEGRYKRGDMILGHQITTVDVRTKSMKLYKKLDDENGYYIYLSNYGISVSDLIKLNKSEKEEVKKVEKTSNNESVKESLEQIAKRSVAPVSVKKTVNVENSVTTKSDCLYTVQLPNINVRDSQNLNARILRILRQGDKFSIQEKVGQWAHIDTIYKKKSGDVMPVTNQNNWVQIIDRNIVSNSNCL